MTAEYSQLLNKTPLRLKTLAEAAQGWKVDTVIPATYEKPCEVGTMLDGEFYHLMTLDCEDYYGDSMPLAKYFVAASPDAILKLLEERDRLREALNRIASWSEGETVNSSFDEPGAAEVARQALEDAR